MTSRWLDLRKNITDILTNLKIKSIQSKQVRIVSPYDCRRQRENREKAALIAELKSLTPSSDAAGLADGGNT